MKILPIPLFVHPTDIQPLTSQKIPVLNPTFLLDIHTLIYSWFKFTNNLLNKSLYLRLKWLFTKCNTLDKLTSMNLLSPLDILRPWVHFLGGGVRGVKPPKFFLTPFRKCLTPPPPLAHFGLPFHAPPEASRTAYCI